MRRSVPDPAVPALPFSRRWQLPGLGNKLRQQLCTMSRHRQSAFRLSPASQCDTCLEDHPQPAVISLVLIEAQV